LQLLKFCKFSEFFISAEKQSILLNKQASGRLKRACPDVVIS
jgi:hypothetical protein